MEVRFGDDDLDRLETDPGFTGGHALGVVKAFRKRMQFIRDAPDERDFYSMGSVRFETLKGERDHQYSMRTRSSWSWVSRTTTNERRRDE